MIPKIIHISWKTKDILEIEHEFLSSTIQNLVKMSPNWKPVISDDRDIDEYLKEQLDKIDYDRIKERHVIEKCDLWRLIKLYNEGGLYIDIDRLCNVNLDDLIDDNIKCILPMCNDNNFSHDFMCSGPGNPIFMEVANMNLRRRASGAKNVYFLGPQTYFHAVTLCLLGKAIDVNPHHDALQHIRNAIEGSGFIKTYKESPPYNTITFQNGKVDFDHEQMKRDFYKSSGIRHWTNEW